MSCIITWGAGPVTTEFPNFIRRSSP